MKSQKSQKIPKSTKVQPVNKIPDADILAVGNIKLPPRSPKENKFRARKWFITIFAFDLKIANNFESLKKSAINWGIGKEVCPETKRDHWHIYLEFKCQKVASVLINLLGKGNYQKARGKPVDCFNYFSKDGNYQTNMKYKRKKPLKLITELFEWQKKIIELIKTEPDDRTIHWYWNKEGNIGKTQLCKYLIAHHQAMIIAGDLKSIGNMLHNYQEQYSGYPDIVVMNIPRECIKISYKGLESIKDGLVINTKYECAQHVFNSPHLIVFANERPEKEKLSKDRWKITEIK